MTLSLDPSGNPILRLYQLFAQPGVVAQDGPRFLGAENLLGDFGGGQARELIRFLRQTALSALASCRLTLDKQPIINFAADSVVDWFEWPIIDELAQQGRLSKDCHAVLSEWQQPLARYEIDYYWPPGGDPVTDCLAVLDELDACDNGGQHFTLEFSLDKAELVEEHLLGGLPGSSEDVSGLVWSSPASMQRAFDNFHDFLRYVVQAARRPVNLFFFEPVDPYQGDYFKVTFLHGPSDTRAQREAALRQQMSAFTPQLLADYNELRTRHKCESRSGLGERFDLPPALLLRQDGHLPSYPDHPLFLEGPLRSLLIYALMAWLAEYTEQRNGVTCFTLPSSGEGTQDVPLEFSLTDVRWAGDSLFHFEAEAETDWQDTLLLLAHDIQRSAGRRPLRELWVRALKSRPADDLTAANFFAGLKAIRGEFIRLERQPLEIGGVQPDLELRIFMDTEGSQIEFELHSASRLEFFHEPVGSTSLGKDDPDRRFHDLSQLAENRLTRILEPDEAGPAKPLPGVDQLVIQGRKLWAELIPNDLKDAYAQFQGQEDLTLFIISNDPSFPWELVKPFSKKLRFDDLWWAVQFSLARWLAGHPPPAREIGFNKVCCVATSSDLSSAAEEVGFFEESGVQLDRPSTRTELLNLLRTKDYHILHFACHGKFDTVQPDRSAVQLPDGSLLQPEDLYLYEMDINEKFEKNRPLIFLNSCHSGRIGPAITHLGGWAERFIDLGCGAFIGCGWEVDDPLAAEFAIAFYEGFRGGDALGQAVHLARQQIRQKSPGNSTWLAYYLYGNPHCRLKEMP